MLFRSYSQHSVALHSLARAYHAQINPSPVGDRYSDEVLRLILSLNDNGNGKH